MARILRWAGVMLALCAILLGAALLFARQLVEFAAGAAVGRDVRIEGDLSIDYGLTTRVHASRLKIANPDWSHYPDMLTVQSATVAISLRALAHGRLVLPELRLQAPALYLQKTTQGLVSWHIGGTAHGSRSGVASALWPPLVEHLSMSNGMLAYDGPGTRNPFTARLQRLEASTDSAQGLTLTANGTLAGQAYRLDAHGPTLQRAAHGSDGTYPFTLHLSSALLRLSASGSLGWPLAQRASDMRVNLEGDSLFRLVPGDRNHSSDHGFTAEGRLSGSGGKWALTDLQARSGGSQLQGSIALDLSGSRPSLRADLNAPAIRFDLARQIAATWKAHAASAHQAGQQASAWSRLDALDAQAYLAVGRLTGSDPAVHDLALDLSLHNGDLMLDPIRFAVGSDRISGRIELQAAQAPRKARLALRYQGAGDGFATAKAEATGFGTGQVSAALQAHIEHLRLSEALAPFGLGQRFAGLLDADINVTTDPHDADMGRIRYRDAAGTDFTLRLSGGPERLRVRGRGRFEKRPFRVDGSAAPLARLPGADEFPFDLHVTALDTRAHIVGALAAPFGDRRLQSTLDIRGPNPRRIEPVVRFRLPELPHYRLTGALTMQDGLWRFSDFSGRVGDSDLSGWMEVDNRAAKPRVRARLHSSLLDLQDLAGIVGAAPGKQSKVFPDANFDFPSFRGFDADIRYAAARVDAGNYPIHSLRLSFRVQDGRLRLTPLVAGVGGGTVKMYLHLVDKPGERPVRGRLKLDVERVSLAQLLRPFPLAAGSAGRIHGHGSFRTRGESVAKMLGAIDGRAWLAMDRGRLNAELVELAGLDLGETLLLKRQGERTVNLNCAYIGARARRGALSIGTALLDTTDTRFTMEGAISLRSEHYDLRILPHPKDASLLSARAPLLLEGSFRRPDFHPAWASLAARGAAAMVLGAIAPPAALLAFIEPGLAKQGHADCNRLPPH
ncbi:AsmA family protein [Noviherbaspirillum pedocola]|uniref:AsmA family protein n=1 Tax=Noviherbaspirillum pedocola TaxID=2801341 RepID=A0A934W948_9BURK|nr:AsmA family protein [Noviherbaspirillum pedocola]MBK4736584.1 AsmA family protein [Noviherbaspirillum pedocola]